MKVLLVKTSSLGDLIHVMPAITDAFTAVENLSLDWAIDEDFAAVGRWHRAVSRVIPVAMRRWRRLASFGQAGTLAREVAATVRAVRLERYDVVLDAQGLFKSAAITRLARGPRIGFSRKSLREKPAASVYGRTIDIPREIPIIERNRKLFAAAIGYEVPASAPDFGLAPEKFSTGPAETPYALFLHSASWRTKLWPVGHWRQLAADAIESGLDVRLAWHGAGERLRAEAIAAGIESAAPTEIGLGTVGPLIAGAALVVAVESGFAHLAAALGRPTVTLYGPTGETRHGTTGPAQTRVKTRIDCSPCYSRRCALLDGGDGDPPCMAGIDTGTVWRAARKLMQGAAANSVPDRNVRTASPR